MNYLEITKSLIKQFAKEESGSGLLEMLVLLAIFGVAAATLSPVLKSQLVEMYDSQAQDITFGGEKGDAVINAVPQTNAAPAVDTVAPSNAN